MNTNHSTAKLRRPVSAQNKKPTECTIYLQFISVINFYMFRLCWMAAGRILPAAIQHKRMTYTKCCRYRQVPPDDEQQTFSKHVEINYWNKLKVNSASCWFLLYGYITLHSQQHIKKDTRITIKNAKK